MAIETGPLFEANEKSKSQSSSNGPAFQPVRLPKFITAPSLAPESPSERRMPQEFTFFVREQIEHASKSEKDSTDNEDDATASKKGKTKGATGAYPQKGITYHAAPEAVNYASVDLEPDAEKDADDAHFADDTLAGQPPRLTVSSFDSRLPAYSSQEAPAAALGKDDDGEGQPVIATPSPIPSPIPAPAHQVHEATWQPPTAEQRAFPPMEGHLDDPLPHQSAHYENMPPIPPSGPAEQGSFNEPPEPPQPPVNRYSYGPNPYSQQQTMYNTAPPSPAAMPHAEAPQMMPETVRAVDRPARALTALEYLLRKRADRKLERRVNERIDAVDKKHDAAAVASQFKLQSEQRQQNTEIHNLQTLPTAEQRTAPVFSGEAPAGHAHQSGEVRLATPVTTAIGQEQAFSRPPIDSLPPIKSIETPQAVQAATGPEEITPQLKPGEHLRQTAWHTYVEKDGHVVNEAIKYGKEFQKEQSVEAHPSATVQQYAGGSASSYQQPYSQPNYGPSNSMLPSGMTTPTLATGQPIPVDPQHQLPPTAKKTFSPPGPLFWVMFAALLVAFFAAALI